MLTSMVAVWRYREILSHQPVGHLRMYMCGGGGGVECSRHWGLDSRTVVPPRLYKSSCTRALWVVPTMDVK
jgi:hypothetical protein